MASLLTFEETETVALNEVFLVRVNRLVASRVLILKPCFLTRGMFFPGNLRSLDNILSSRHCTLA